MTFIVRSDGTLMAFRMKGGNNRERCWCSPIEGTWRLFLRISSFRLQLHRDCSLLILPPPPPPSPCPRVFRTAHWNIGPPRCAYSTSILSLNLWNGMSRLMRVMLDYIVYWIGQVSQRSLANEYSFQRLMSSEHSSSVVTNTERLNENMEFFWGKCPSLSYTCDMLCEYYASTLDYNAVLSRSECYSEMYSVAYKDLFLIRKNAHLYWLFAELPMIVFGTLP